jgi:CheY-like chemotaxis protein
MIRVLWGCLMLIFYNVPQFISISQIYHMGKEIFLVDDDPDFQFIFFKLLKSLRKQYSVKFFENPKALYHHLKVLHTREASDFPSLIILDLNMPGMNGVQLLKIIRHSRSLPGEKVQQIPIVVMSGDISNEGVQQCYEAGADAVLHKQPDLQLMKATLQSACDFWLERDFAVSTII